MNPLDDSRQRFGRTFQLGPSLANVTALAERRQRWVRLARAAVAIGVILAVGTYGYWYLGDSQHSLVEALYMTVISISTVGFNEVIPITSDTMRIFTMSLIFLGGASVVYFLAAVAAFIIEGDVLYGFWRRRLRARLRGVRGHVIVAGLGRVGAHGFSELFPSRVDVVGVDRMPEKIENLIATHGERMIFAVGEAFDEGILRAVGVERAHALIACLPDDRDNFLLGVTARQLAPELRLLFRLVDPINADMFEDLKPEAVIHPPAITGKRVANTLLRSEMLAFTDALIAADTGGRVLHEVIVDERRAGLRLGELAFSGESGSDVLVVGHRRAHEARHAFHPGAQVQLAAGDSLLLLMQRSAIKRLDQAPRREVAPRRGSSLTAILPDVAAGGSEAWRGHVIVAGAGAVGRAIVRALLAMGQQVCVIERDGRRRASCPEDARLRFIEGDVFRREVMHEAGIESAHAFVSALQSLRDNLFLCAYVSHSNSRARVIARVGSPLEAKRLRAVGAHPVNPGEIGGVHLARLAIHPELVSFTEGLEATLERTEQLATVTVPAGSPLVGKSLGEARIQERTGCVVLGSRKKDGPWTYHPGPSERLKTGASLVALGENAQLVRLLEVIG